MSIYVARYASLPCGAPRWDLGLYEPHAVIVNLGTNDFEPGIPEPAPFQAALAGVQIQGWIDRPTNLKAW
jgi:hypothetical protein